MRKHHNSRSNAIARSAQKGVTMIEMMIVLALGAMVTIIGVSLYQTNSAQTEIEREVRNISSLVPLIKGTFMTAQGSYEGLSNEVMLRSNSFPDGMKVQGNDTLIRHSWNNDGVDLDSINFMGTDHDSFKITYKDVPNSACQDLVSRIYRSFERLEIAGTQITTVGDISNQCNSAPNVDIELTTR